MTQTRPNIAVLIVAGGNGTRMNNDIPKQYMRINGKTILQHTVEKFEKIDEITSVHFVIGKDHEDEFKVAISNDRYSYSFGGKTRQESVNNGLKALKETSPDIVLIHDAARPCITENDIRNLIEGVRQHKAATLAQPLSKSIQRDGHVVDRDNLWIIQTPQGFYFNDIFAAHEQAKDQYTDDTAVYMAYSNKPIHYVSCGRHNLKITTKDDLEMAEKLLSSPMETITGQGFDVHAFEDTPCETIRICGIDVPYNRSLEGHSDADIGLHVLTDAIFSAVADGDIGYHFPSNNNDFKNMDSHVFLDKAIDSLRKIDGVIRHIDITFICEKPNIGKHRTEMREHLSEYLNLPINRISIKGTTSQKLGFTGRGEGIAAQAIVTIRIPKMIKLYDITATWFYSGYIKPASGTWGTLASLPLCVAIVHYCGLYGLVLGAMIVFCIGLWAAHQYEKATGEHDSSRVVIDETAGMLLASIPLTFSFSWQIILFCFVAFRLFDAVKIGPVGWLDKNIHGALGVMLDDIAAGLIASIVVLGVLLWMI